MTLTPPFPYFGGKITLGPAIADLLPPHEHYVEPYAGSLAVLLAKRPSTMETVNDLDEAIVTFWRVLRSRTEELLRTCALTPHSRVEYQQASELDADDEIELARQVWVKLTQGRAGVLRRTGWRNYVKPSGSSIGMPGYLSGYLGRMLPAAERLKHVSIECRPALEIVARYGVSDEVLLYVDPPYLGSTRHDSNDYRHEMRGDSEHRELAEALHGARAGVVLSGYPSPLYDDLYSGWTRVEMPSFTGQGGKWANRTEVLWSNRPLGDPMMFDLAGGSA